MKNKINCFRLGCKIKPTYLSFDEYQCWKHKNRNAIKMTYKDLLSGDFE